MPITYTVDHERGVVHMHVTGTTTLPMLREYFDAILVDDAYLAAKLELIEVRDMESYLEAEELRQFAELVQTQIGKLGERRVAVISDDDLVYGMVRMYSSLVEQLGLDVDAFRRRDDAEVWLGLRDSPSNVGRDDVV